MSIESERASCAAINGNKEPIERKRETKRLRQAMKAHINSIHPENKTREVSFKTAATFARWRDEIAHKKVLDIGASTGVVSECLAEFLGCEVAAFEPLEFSTENWVARNPCVVLHKKAVTFDGRDIEMCIDPKALDDGYLCSASVVRQGTPKRKKIRLAAASASFADVLRDERPEVLKVDIEGGEYELLVGAHILPQQLNFIMVEFHSLPGRSIQFLNSVIWIIKQGFAPYNGFLYNMRVESGRLTNCGFWVEIFFKRTEQPLPYHIDYLEKLIKELEQSK